MKFRSQISNVKLLGLILFASAYFPAYQATAQVPLRTGVAILKAEDARRYDATLENLMHAASADIRLRAALAAGRIGDEKAIPVLNELLANDPSTDVRAMAAFALGEIESVKGSDAILKVLGDGWRAPVAVLAGAVEAAGKIAAANPKDDRSKTLGAAILHVLESQAASPMPADVTVVRLGLTAILRARPEGADVVTAKFLVESDPRLRADAANTLARLKAKNANETLRIMLVQDSEPVARANAARALGAAEDQTAIDVLQQAAVGDDDLRVRVSAIRALGSLHDAKSGSYLVAYGEALLLKSKREGVRQGRPKNTNELLEVVTSIGRLLQNSENERAIKFLAEVRVFDECRSPETEIALATLAPKYYFENEVQGLVALRKAEPTSAAAILQGYGKIVSLKEKDEYKKMAQWTTSILLELIEGWFWDQSNDKYSKRKDRAVPEMLRAFVADKSDQDSGILQPMLDREKDVFIRATLAELLSEQPKSTESIETLIVAFAKSLETDRDYNDAQLAILDALFKLDKRGSVGSLLRPYPPPFFSPPEGFWFPSRTPPQKGFPPPFFFPKRNAMHEVLPHTGEMTKAMSRSGTKLGQILNTDADYARALSRKNGAVTAVITTEKGTFTIDLMPEDAPLTVDNFIKLARSGYFNGIEVHRVVPNFVMQDGDPRGDGNGGPGWSIRCEINMLPYDRGAVGMALSGKDTGGSQWFVTHSPQPHLDGGYTVFGHVNETDMKVVDNIVRGDRIIIVRIVEGGLTTKTPRTQRKRTK